MHSEVLTIISEVSLTLSVSYQQKMLVRLNDFT